MLFCSLLTTNLPVASPPTDVTVTRTGYSSVLVSWSAPSSAVPAGYEVFYQVDGGSTLSGGNTSNTELTLTGLTLGNHSFFVVGYGAEGAPVLPSAHSNTTSVVIGEIVFSLFILKSGIIVCTLMLVNKNNVSFAKSIPRKFSLM